MLIVTSALVQSNLWSVMTSAFLQSKLRLMVVSTFGDGNVLDVGPDLGSPIEQVKVDEVINLGVLTSLRCSVSM